jgi:hypothetical protein
MSWSGRRRHRAPAPAVPLVAALVVLVVFAAGCGSSSSVERLPRPHDPSRTDPSARAELLDLVARGSHEAWWVDSTFVRTAEEQTLRNEVTEVNRPPDHVVVGGGGATGTVNGRPLSCTPSEGGPLCATGETGGAAVGNAGLAQLTDVATGWYALRRVPQRTVAGMRARCFRMDWNERGTSQPYGTRAVLCYVGPGIPVTRDVDRVSTTDRMTARTVRRTVDDAQLAALVAPYTGAGPVRPLSPSSSVVPVLPGR